jgi:N-acetylglutamate synthase-like GNAT family acetyltransferase
MPVENNTADVVVSNCVMNLVPNKQKAFSETVRIIKPGGHFSISDLVLKGELPENLRAEAALYAACVAGALQKDDYLQVIKEAGFINIVVQKERKNDIPDEILQKFLTPQQLQSYKSSHIGIFSITVYAEKPLTVTFRKADEKDTSTIRSILEEQKLPTETVGTNRTDFYLAVNNETVVGVAGYEYYGDEALLRSVAVPASLQKNNIGSQLVNWMVRLAKQKGMKRIVLLTETASPFFKKLGFEKIDRSSIGNEAMNKYSQLSGGCCSSATCMRLEVV